MVEQPPTPQEHQDWLQHPLTVDLLRRLHLGLTEKKDEWAARRFTRESMSEGAMANSFELGGVAAVQEVIAVIEGKA